MTSCTRVYEWGRVQRMSETPEGSSASVQKQAEQLQYSRSKVTAACQVLHSPARDAHLNTAAERPRRCAQFQTSEPVFARFLHTNVLFSVCDGSINNVECLFAAALAALWINSLLQVCTTCQRASSQLGHPALTVMTPLIPQRAADFC